MKIEYPEAKRRDQYGLGWSHNVLVDGKMFRISVRPGKRVRLAYSSKFGYHWHVSVYTQGEETISMPCHKRTSSKAIIEEALYRRFCVYAFGRHYDDIEGLLYDQAVRAREYSKTTYYQITMMRYDAEREMR